MIALLLLLAVVWFFVYHFHLKRQNLPPGPTPLRNLHKFRETGDKRQRMASAVQRRVHPVDGQEPMVVIADHQLMVDAFVKGGPYGIILGEGDSWREQRRFALHVLRDFGLGKNLMQEKILEEVETLYNRVSKQRSAGRTSIRYNFQRYDTEERLAEFHDLRSRARHFMAISGNPLFIAMRSSGQVNIFKHLPVLAPIYREAHKAGNYLVDFFRQRAREYEEMIQRNPEEALGFVRAFLQEQRKQREASNTDSFTQKQLVCNLFDLWIAGQETQRIANSADQRHPQTTRDVRIGSSRSRKNTWIVPQVSILLYDPNV
ncbi:Cytochrome P450-33C9 [Aphelenchoides fujianensis]|nr:Cytochrome P450-33C9 [Aphelenchoides fujianensis]